MTPLTGHFGICMYLEDFCFMQVFELLWSNKRRGSWSSTTRRKMKAKGPSPWRFEARSCSSSVNHPPRMAKGKIHEDTYKWLQGQCKANEDLGKISIPILVLKESWSNRHPRTTCIERHKLWKTPEDMVRKTTVRRAIKKARPVGPSPN